MANELTVHRDTGEIVSQDVNPQIAIEQWRNYQEITKQLLDDSDYLYGANGQSYKKKSAWRKYMRAFRLREVATKIVVETRDDKGWPLIATAMTKVADVAGHEFTGYQECHLTERCCPAAYGETCTNSSLKHQCCATNCSGRKHWSNPGDIPATAHTRSKNRAISDAIGAGEVSAEEINTTGNRSESYGNGNNPRYVKVPDCPSCKNKKAVITNKFGAESWLCYKKKDGCGLKFNEADKVKTEEQKPIEDCEAYKGSLIKALESANIDETVKKSWTAKLKSAKESNIESLRKSIESNVDADIFKELS